MLYLEDLYTGQLFTSPTHTITADEIVAFAKQFDPQPFHLDAKLARSTHFGELVASGWHTAALSMRLMLDSDLKVAGGLFGNGGELHWPQPTRPGDELRVEIEILEVRPSRTHPDRGIARFRAETRNQRQDTVQTFEAMLVVQRRPTK
ncbi:MAG: MaoC family dehydratase [Gemmataceae bacterium]